MAEPGYQLWRIIMTPRRYVDESVEHAVAGIEVERRDLMTLRAQVLRPAQ